MKKIQSWCDRCHQEIEHSSEMFTVNVTGWAGSLHNTTYDLCPKCAGIVEGQVLRPLHVYEDDPAAIYEHR